MENFEIRRFSPHESFSGKLAAPAIRGLAVGAHPGDPESFVLAGNVNYLGFLNRVVTATPGPTFPTSFIFINQEGPDVAGYETTAVRVDEYEAEGADYLVLTGARALSPTTAIGTPTTFNGLGQAMLATGTDAIFFRVSANSAPGGLVPVTPGAARLRFVVTP